MKIFDIITPRRMTWVALAAAIVYAIVAFAIGGEAMWLLLAVPPLLLLSGMLWLRWLPTAWAGAILALVIALLGFGIGPVVGGILALIGIAAFVSELPHLHHPHAPGQLPSRPLREWAVAHRLATAQCFWGPPYSGTRKARSPSTRATHYEVMCGGQRRGATAALKALLPPKQNIPAVKAPCSYIFAREMQC